jgi:hypothetical protein
MQRLRRRRDLTEFQNEEQVWDHPPNAVRPMGMALVIGGGLGAIHGETELPLTTIAS